MFRRTVKVWEWQDHLSSCQSNRNPFPPATASSAISQCWNQCTKLFCQNNCCSKHSLLYTLHTYVIPLTFSQIGPPVRLFGICNRLHCFPLCVCEFLVYACTSLQMLKDFLTVRDEISNRIKQEYVFQLLVSRWLYSANMTGEPPKSTLNGIYNQFYCYKVSFGVNVKENLMPFLSLDWWIVLNKTTNVHLEGNRSPFWFHVDFKAFSAMKTRAQTAQSRLKSNINLRAVLSLLKLMYV